jgi:hypothetical protein
MEAGQGFFRTPSSLDGVHVCSESGRMEGQQRRGLGKKNKPRALAPALEGFGGLGYRNLSCLPTLMLHNFMFYSLMKYQLFSLNKLPRKNY